MDGPSHCLRGSGSQVGTSTCCFPPSRQQLFVATSHSSHQTHQRLRPIPAGVYLSGPRDLTAGSTFAMTTINVSRGANAKLVSPPRAPGHEAGWMMEYLCHQTGARVTLAPVGAFLKSAHQPRFDMIPSGKVRSGLHTDALHRGTPLYRENTA